MRKAFKVVGLLLLGAILGQVLLVGVSGLRLYFKAKDPNFLLQSTMPEADHYAMDSDEFEVWNDMREKIRKAEYAEVNQLIRIESKDWDVQVLPAKPVFAQGENVLAAIRFKNISSHTIYVNEPRVRRMTSTIYSDKGVNQLWYEISISPLESTWMRTLLPGQVLSIPLLIHVEKAGSYKINCSLFCSEFNKTGVTTSQSEMISSDFAIQ